MTEEEFKDLLIEYLTDPPYARVMTTGDGFFMISMPDGGGEFFIRVIKSTRKIVPPSVP